VVVLAGIMMTMGLKMTVANLNNGAYAETVSKQAQIKIALINYLRTNNTIPCPNVTPAPATPSGFAGPSPCPVGYGVIPWLTLNIPKDTAVDGWGNYFIYRVANGVAPTARNWTVKTAALNAFDINELKTPSAGLTVMQGDGITPNQTATTSAVVVLVSTGKNGLGGRGLQGLPNALVPALNVDEVKNATFNASTFVIRPYTEVNKPGYGVFDDVVTYMLPQDLLQPLVAEQSLGACQAYCSPCTGLGTSAGGAQPYCMGPNSPATAVGASPCISAGKPYATCTAAGAPKTCFAISVPVGNPTPNCP